MARKVQRGPGALPSSGKVPREGGTGRQPCSLGGWGCSSGEPPSKRPEIIPNPLSNTGPQSSLSLFKSSLKLRAPPCLLFLHFTSHYPVCLSVLSVSITLKFPSSSLGHQTGPGTEEVLNKYLLKAAVSLTFTLHGARDRVLSPPSLRHVQYPPEMA